VRTILLGIENVPYILYFVKIVLQGSEGGEARAEVTDTILGTEATEATEADTSRVQHDKIYQLLSEIESDSDSIGEITYSYNQCWESVTFCCGSPDPYLGLMDPELDPDPTPDPSLLIFVILFPYNIPADTLSSVLKAIRRRNGSKKPKTFIINVS
jgi:hypothetical protein